MKIQREKRGIIEEMSEIAMKISSKTDLREHINCTKDLKMIQLRNITFLTLISFGIDVIHKIKDVQLSII